MDDSFIACYNCLMKKTCKKYGLQYGITSLEYDKMLVAQGNCCYICGRHQIEFKKRLCVDHDHTTGSIRGLLCTNCNAKLGWFENHESKIFEYLKGRLS